MRIAIILDNITMAGVDNNIKNILLFDAEDDLVIAVDEDHISILNTNYLCLWLLAKEVVRLYCNGLTETGKAFLKRAGIEIYPLEKIRDHPILQALLLKTDRRESAKA